MALDTWLYAVSKTTELYTEEGMCKSHLNKPDSKKKKKNPVIFHWYMYIAQTKG